MQKLDKILVIGPGSLVGSRFIELLTDVKVWAGGKRSVVNASIQGFSELDITDEKNVLEVVKNSSAEVFINFAGATAVDEIEKTRPGNPNDVRELADNLAYRVNVLGTRNLINAAKKTNKFPIFISTGTVFDGKNGPYNEEDTVALNPDEISWYAWTKVLAEREVLAGGISYLMLRISYPFRKNYPQKRDFARNILNLYDGYKNGKIAKIYPIFSDQKLTPTFIDDLAPAVTTLVPQNQTGIFHVTSPEVTTPYDFACELLKIARDVKKPEQVLTKGNMVEFRRANPDIAIRPLKGGEKSEKITRLGFKPTGWREGIKEAFGD